MDDDFIPIGKVVKTHGIKGELKVLALSDIPDRLKNISSIYSIKNGNLEKLTISYCHLNKNLAIIRFKEINSISCAERLVGSSLCIKDETLFSLPKNRYYIHNLVGLEVYDESKNRIGRLKEVWQLPANDVFVVEEGDKETLFPAVKEAIKEISIEKREIIVDRNFGVT